MSTTPRRAGAALALAAALSAGALTGCAGINADAIREADQVGGSSGSRAQTYTSLEEMTDAADLVLTATAGAQQVVQDLPGSTLPFTITDLSVDQVLRADETTAAAGSTVVMRQTATPSGSTSSQSDATLEPGQRYLLFLVHSELSGDAATHYYPVGAVAGIYQGDGDAYTRAVPDSDDELPTTITPAQLRG